MKIKSEVLSVQRYSHLPDGTKAEPEQQPAARIIESEAATKMQDGRPVGVLPVRFILETTAAEEARKVKKLCRGCKHFRRKAWQAFMAECDSPLAAMDKRRMMNEVRFMLESQQSDEVIAMHSIDTETGPDFNTEHAMQSLGFCGALSEVAKDQIVMHPLASCPTELVVGTMPDGSPRKVPVATPERPAGYYEPKSLAAERRANLEYDEIMRVAQGKK